ESDPELLLAISRAGAGAMLALPLDAEELRAALACLKATHSPPLPVSARRIIAVASATGGCGASTLAINLSYEIATHFNRSCILADFAHGGMVAECLDLTVRHTLSDLLCDMRSLDGSFLERALLSVNDNFRVLAAPRLEEEPLQGTPEDILVVVD